ncbi:MAG TPA: helix-turn-helix domain-containing protein [Candidatus Limnocylindrales bacterium]|jgi:PucR family transcriptional regulator, purine catabolism regulatory protein|nr:helix-turn-helix domain-containing protein [Candidatus Limnocylindrales bacterium]
MATLEQVWRAVFPQARPVEAAAPGLERSVAWVRVLKARTPAFDALDADDLALAAESTLRSLAGLAVEPASVVEALAGARASGLVVVGDGALDEALVRPTLERATQLGLAAFTLAEGDVAALERSAIGYVVNGRAELEQRAAALEAELEQAALAGAGVDGLAATIARFLSRPVAIEAADGRPLAVHAPLDAAEAAPQLSEYLRRGRGAALRVALPGNGTLVLLGRLAPTELERVVVRRISGFLALLLGRAGDASPAALERAAGGLPADGPPWVSLVARQVDPAAPATLEERERLRAEIRQSESPRRLALRGDATSLELRMVAATGQADPRGLEVAQRISRQLGRTVAVSAPFHEPSARPLAEAEARATLEALDSLPAAERQALAGGSGSLVGRSDMAPAYRIGAALAGLPDAQRHARALLAPLLSGRPARDRQALATLRAVLDHAGLAEAATALSVHRNTLAYRLARIEERTGWRLADPLLRFSLSVAVRVVQSAQDGPADSASGPTRTPG